MRERDRMSPGSVVERDRVVEILTRRDVRLADPSLRADNLMTPKVVTAGEGITIDDAKDFFTSVE